MNITKDIKYIGVNDHEIDLFEGQYIVPNGMAYNSYAIVDEKIAIMDSVDARFGQQWLKNIENALDGRKPDYLVVQHMEPDHSANIFTFAEAYPDAVVTIYDRFGKKLVEMKGNEAWDGTYLGRKMPATDYWYEIWIDEIRKKYVGHFTLIND